MDEIALLNGFIDLLDKPEKWVVKEIFGKSLLTDIAEQWEVNEYAHLNLFSIRINIAKKAKKYFGWRYICSYFENGETIFHNTILK